MSPGRRVGAAGGDPRGNRRHAHHPRRGGWRTSARFTWRRTRGAIAAPRFPRRRRPAEDFPAGAPAPPLVLRPLVRRLVRRATLRSVRLDSVQHAKALEMLREVGGARRRRAQDGIVFPAHPPPTRRGDTGTWWRARPRTSPPSRRKPAGRPRARRSRRGAFASRAWRRWNRSWTKTRWRGWGGATAVRAVARRRRRRRPERGRTRGRFFDR